MGRLLEEFRDRFVGDRYGPHGCPTCGYSSEMNMSEEAYQELLAEIDAWVEEQFGKKGE